MDERSMRSHPSTIILQVILGLYVSEVASYHKEDALALHSSFSPAVAYGLT